MTTDRAYALPDPTELGDEFVADPQLTKGLVRFCTVFQPRNTYTHLVIEQNNINITK
jgi:hypothetical protein